MNVSNARQEKSPKHNEKRSIAGSARRASFAIRAFNVEVACIRDQVTNPTIGIGRIVFWRDTINKVRCAVMRCEILILQRASRLRTAVVKSTAKLFQQIVVDLARILSTIFRFADLRKKSPSASGGDRTFVGRENCPLVTEQAVVFKVNQIAAFNARNDGATEEKVWNECLVFLLFASDAVC